MISWLERWRGSFRVNTPSTSNGELFSYKICCRIFSTQNDFDTRELLGFACAESDACGICIFSTQSCVIFSWKSLSFFVENSHLSLFNRHGRNIYLTSVSGSWSL